MHLCVGGNTNMCMYVGISVCEDECTCMWVPRLLLPVFLGGICSSPMPAILTSEFVLGIRCLYLLSAGITGWPPCPLVIYSIFIGARDPNSHPHVWMSSTLSAKLSPQPLSFIIFKFFIGVYSLHIVMGPIKIIYFKCNVCLTIFTPRCPSLSPCSSS